MLQHPYSIYNFTVKSYHSDQNGKLTLYSLFQFLQECAWDNARVNDFGYESLEKANAYWVLSRVLVQLDEYPEWKDEISIKTWPKGTDGFFALRDFLIYKNDKIIGRVATSWLILDRTSKRPKKLDNFNFIHENFLNESAIDKKPEKISFDSTLLQIDSRKVYSGDLDVNKHVNNATYVKWIMDSVVTKNGKSEINEFEINFLAELLLNDSFVVSITEMSNNTQFVVLNHVENSREICKARISFN
ncbi:MAG: acyl-[acyl-carrier-protein] thioesterase [Bacteroidales bacterium]